MKRMADYPEGDLGWTAVLLVILACLVAWAIAVGVLVIGQ